MDGWMDGWMAGWLDDGSGDDDQMIIILFQLNLY
jgi:hypothetical protein